MVLLGQRGPSSSRVRRRAAVRIQAELARLEWRGEFGSIPHGDSWCTRGGDPAAPRPARRSNDHPTDPDAPLPHPRHGLRHHRRADDRPAAGRQPAATRGTGRSSARSSITSPRGPTRRRQPCRGTLACRSRSGPKRGPSQPGPFGGFLGPAYDPVWTEFRPKGRAVLRDSGGPNAPTKKVSDPYAASFRPTASRRSPPDDALTLDRLNGRRLAARPARRRAPHA